MKKAMDDGAKSTPQLEDVEIDNDDEAFELATEMAMAAAQNPNLSAEEVRKLVAGKNRQTEILQKNPKIREIREKEEEETKKRRELVEAQKRWDEKTAWISETVTQTADQLNFQVQKQIYADVIRRDPEIIELNKQIDSIQEELKATRSQVSRQASKRQKLVEAYKQTNSRLEKQRRELLSSEFNIDGYSKAMVRAGKKWKKNSSDEELSLEAKLCQNMHQMLTVEKQKAKVKKHSQDMKKYCKRATGWLSDKKAFFELHLIMLDATNHSLQVVCEEVLSRQDSLIMKLKDSKEFRKVDLSSVDVPGFHFTEEEKAWGFLATLNALRGLAIMDSNEEKNDKLLTFRKDPTQKSRLNQAHDQEQEVKKHVNASDHSESIDQDQKAATKGGGAISPTKDKETVDGGTSSEFDVEHFDELNLSDHSKSTNPDETVAAVGVNKNSYEDFGIPLGSTNSGDDVADEGAASELRVEDLDEVNLSDNDVIAKGDEDFTSPSGLAVVPAEEHMMQLPSAA